MPRISRDSAPLKTFDLFCGAGGSSWGAQLAGAEVLGGVDMDPIAIDTFRSNFPGAKWVKAQKAEDVDLDELHSVIGDVDVLMASPECTNHTHARGSARRSEASRSTAYQVVNYAAELKPNWIVVENVVNMRRWRGYRRFLRQLAQLGYLTTELKLNSADFGVPQARRRLFLVCELNGTDPFDFTPPTDIQRVFAESFIDMNGKYQTSPLKVEGRASRTLKHAQTAVEALGHGKPFLIVYYGSDAAGGWQRLDAPLRTVTTLDRFALVRLEDGQEVMRMLQVPELKDAMGFVDQLGGRTFELEYGTRRDRIRLLGNAVCPPVMQWLFEGMAAGSFDSHGVRTGAG